MEIVLGIVCIVMAGVFGCLLDDGNQEERDHE